MVSGMGVGSGMVIWDEEGWSEAVCCSGKFWLLVGDWLRFSVCCSKLGCGWSEVFSSRSEAPCSGTLSSGTICSGTVWVSVWGIVC